MRARGGGAFSSELLKVSPVVFVDFSTDAETDETIAAPILAAALTPDQQGGGFRSEKVCHCLYLRANLRQ